MQTEIRKQWWQQLGGMSQGMLFLQGHVIHSAQEAKAQVPLQEERRHHVHDTASKARHRRAIQRLYARHLRMAVALLSAGRPLP